MWWLQYYSSQVVCADPRPTPQGAREAARAAAQEASQREAAATSAAARQRREQDEDDEEALAQVCAGRAWCIHQHCCVYRHARGTSSRTTTSEGVATANSGLVHNVTHTHYY